MGKTNIINSKTLSLSTFFVLCLFALYRIILEIYYSNNFWGYDTYTQRSTTFGIYLAILLIPTIIMMLKVFENASFRLKFSTASIQFLLAVLIATEIFNGGSFSGDGDIRMIILNTLVTVVLILLPILFVVQLSLYENQNNSKDRIIDRTQKVSYQLNSLILLIVHMCLIGLVMYFDCILRAPRPDFVKSYGKILLAYPLPFVVIFLLTVANTKKKLVSLRIINGFLTLVGSVTAYCLIFADPKFSYSIKNLAIYNIYIFFTFPTAVTFVVICAIVSMLINELKKTKKHRTLKI